MLVRLGQPTDHGFDSPLGLLSDCHRRIERFLWALVAVSAERRGGPLGGEDRRVLEAALRYFETAAPRHSADEEQSLFPRLRASADPEAAAALDALAALEADHRVADLHHEAVNALCRTWLADDALSPDAAQSLRGHLEALERLYRAHIAIEDAEIFPAAGRALTGDDLERVGREMAARRGVPFEPPADLSATAPGRSR